MVSLLCASSICISKNENFIAAAAAAVTTVYTEDISFLLFLLILVYTFNID